MSETFVQILFGWPTIALSLLVSVIGIFKSKYWLLIIGAALIVPFSYYLNGSPRFNGFGLLLPLFQISSAAAVRESKTQWAWPLLLPTSLAGLWVLVTALSYQFR